MFKVSSRLTALVVLTMLLTACWPVPTPPNPMREIENKVSQDLGQVTGTLQEFAKLGEQADQAKQSGASDEEVGAQMLEGIMQYGAKMEVQEFEKMEAVDPPEGFPAELVYSDGKVIESSDNSSDGYISLHITIKTASNSKDVREFYKNYLGESPWKITSQSAESYGGSFSAEHTEGASVDVGIDGDQYSALTTIEVDYHK